MPTFPSLTHQILPKFIFFIILISTSCLGARTLNNEEETPNTDFITKSCNTTTYPELCNSALSTYASQVQNNPKELACAALNATLGEAQKASGMIKSISKGRPAKGRDSYAVKDCMEELKDALDELKMSMDEMERASPDYSDFRFRVSNVQTWVSAALTDNDTCMDGITENNNNNNNNNNTQKYTSVHEQIVKVTHLTSVALGLINNYAASVNINQN